jgi:hypothetical protein
VASLESAVPLISDVNSAVGVVGSFPLFECVALESSYTSLAGFSACQKTARVRTEYEYDEPCHSHCHETHILLAASPRSGMGSSGGYEQTKHDKADKCQGVRVGTGTTDSTRSHLLEDG